MGSKQALTRKYIERIDLEKTAGKRGRYRITITMKNGKVITYSYYSSGPWNKYELI